MARKLTYAERERRRRAKEAEREKNQRRRQRDREHAARLRRRERDEAVRRRASERAAVRRERERERDRIEREKQRARDAKERERRSQERAVARAAQEFEDRMEWLTSVHAGRHDLDEFEDALNRRLQPVEMEIAAYEPAAFDDAREWSAPIGPSFELLPHRKWVPAPDESFSMIPGGALVGFALATLIAWMAASFDAEVMLSGWMRQTGLLVGGLLLGAATGFGSLVLQLFKRGGPHEETAADFAREQQAADKERLEDRRNARATNLLLHEVALQVWREERQAADRTHAERLQSYRDSELARFTWYDEHKECEQIRFARRDRVRIDRLEAAMTDSDACTLMLRRAFPLFLPRAAQKGPDGNWGSIYGSLVRGRVKDQKLVLRLDIYKDGIVPLKTIGVAASGRKNTARNMPAAKRTATHDGFVASWALAHAIRAWKVAPWLEEVLVEVIQDGIDPATGKRRDEVLLSARYPKRTMSDCVFSNLDAVAFLDRVEHQRRSVRSKSKKMLSSWLPARHELEKMSYRLDKEDFLEAASLQPEYEFAKRSSPFATRTKLFPAAKDWTAPRWRVVRKKATARKHWTPPELRERLTDDRTHSTVSEAVEAAAPGDTIYVEPGVYVDSVRIHKPVTLQGAPGVQIRKKDDDAIRVYSVGVSARKLHLTTDSDRGRFVGPLYLAGTSIAVVEDCTLASNARYGVHQTQPGSVLHLIGCTVSPLDGVGPRVGVRSPPEARSLLEDCQITDAETGIAATDLDAERVVVKGCEVGVHNTGDRLDPDVALVSLVGCTVQDGETALKADAHGRIEHTECVFARNTTEVGDGRGEVVELDAATPA